MLEFLSSGLVSIWLEMAGVKIKPADALDAVTWQSSPGLVIAPDPNPAGVNTVKEYLKGLITTKLIDQNLAQSQGVWLQSGPILMANHEGTTPLPAASLTKIATSIVAFKTLGPEYQFETTIATTGSVVKGVLQGDLIVNGGGDPMFVWEEAIALGNTLNKMGIKQVKGNLVITGNFAMNFQRHPLLAGQMLKQALNSKAWTRPAIYIHSIMSKGTPKPQVAINGTVAFTAQPNPKQTLLVRHRSLPLKQIIKEMNVYSNNEIAQMLAEAVGGHTIVQTKAAKFARVPETEIQLINGSGLGPESRISPRAACAMLMALQQDAATHQLNLADLFPTAGFDHRGTMQHRHLPQATVMKTGTLRDVSALAGVVPTRDRGLVWFAIINRGPQIGSFRQQQDKLIQSLVQKLQIAPATPITLTPHSLNSLPDLGNTSRSEMLHKTY